MGHLKNIIGREVDFVTRGYTFGIWVGSHRQFSLIKSICTALARWIHLPPTIARSRVRVPTTTFYCLYKI